jgi:hypothetical protein
VPERGVTTDFDQFLDSVGKELGKEESGPQCDNFSFRTTVVVGYYCPKNVYILRTEFGKEAVRKVSTKIGQQTTSARPANLDLKQAIVDRIRRDKSVQVWSPNDLLFRV